MTNSFMHDIADFEDATFGETGVPASSSWEKCHEAQMLRALAREADSDGEALVSPIVATQDDDLVPSPPPQLSIRQYAMLFHTAASGHVRWRSWMPWNKSDLYP